MAAAHAHPVVPRYASAVPYIDEEVMMFNVLITVSECLIPGLDSPAS